MLEFDVYFGVEIDADSAIQFLSAAGMVWQRNSDSDSDHSMKFAFLEYLEDEAGIRTGAGGTYSHERGFIALAVEHFRRGPADAWFAAGLRISAHEAMHAVQYASGRVPVAPAAYPDWMAYRKVWSEQEADAESIDVLKGYYGDSLHAPFMLNGVEYPVPSESRYAEAWLQVRRQAFPFGISRLRGPFVPEWILSRWPMTAVGA